MSRGDHTRWTIPAEHRADPAYVEAAAAAARVAFNPTGSRAA
ncbi:hypothetical protein [Streptomyces tateyamensis]|nr:hypothetical protein [Streptomyces tateyamensis]